MHTHRETTGDAVQNHSPRDVIDGVFAARDWIALASVALMWGSTFWLIKVGLEDFPPATVAWLRVAFGALTLSLIPTARRPLQRSCDGWLVAGLGLVWMAIPFLLFTFAEQHISSALAGMINGATPLFTAALAAAFMRRAPGRALLSGLLVGFLGVLALGIPNIDGRASLAGVAMALGAAFCYGIAFNITGPLQDRNGALTVIWRAQLVALVALAPFGAKGLLASTPTLTGILAMVIFGALGTGLAYVLMAQLVGRVGASRASTATYLVPIVALLLGAGIAHERVASVSLLGVLLVLLGAYLASAPRRQK